ncbi:hypothetical protein L596_029803 [Steinernema carpocapsae]|uniref:Uncharacterized protein n=1 Tax=Steinernema carpocapsae TaxID=34508 RepID=A0A4U5LQW1_STECR|nr:hypothetical protein L596_029803 [Steinernema carpocapsae]
MCEQPIPHRFLSQTHTSVSQVALSNIECLPARSNMILGNLINYLARRLRILRRLKIVQKLKKLKYVTITPCSLINVIFRKSHFGQTSTEDSFQSVWSADSGINEEARCGYVEVWGDEELYGGFEDDDENLIQVVAVVEYRTSRARLQACSASQSSYVIKDAKSCTLSELYGDFSDEEEEVEEQEVDVKATKAQSYVDRVRGMFEKTAVGVC